MAPRATPFPGAERFLPSRISLASLRKAAASCRGCSLYKNTTQTVFGEGPRRARRWHKKPGKREMDPCLPWLQMELKLIKPDVPVCLGATAAQALLGADFRVTVDRGRVLPTSLASARWPRFTLRRCCANRAAQRRTEMRRFTADLEVAARLLGTGAKKT